MSKTKFNWSVKKTAIESPEIKERLEGLSDIRFIYNQEPLIGAYSCAKLMFGDKYFIVRTKTIQWLESRLNQVIKQYNMNGTTDKLYIPIAKYIHNTGYYDVRVEFICQSTNAYEVIKAEFMALIDGKSDKNCMNQIFEPYTPKWNSKDGKFGWLTQADFLNYKKLVKKYYEA